MLRTRLLLLTGIIGLTCTAQNNETDSLLRLLSTAKEDTNKVMLYFETGASVIYQAPASAMPYFRQGTRLAHRLEYYPGLERNYTGLTLSHALLARYDSNFLFADTAVFYAVKAGNPSRLALTFLNRADVKTNLGMYNDALHDCDTALKYAEISGNKDRFGRIYMIFNNIYENQRRYDKAEEYLDKALVLHREMNNPQMVGQGYFYKAQLSARVGKYAEAKRRIEYAIHLADSIGDIQNLPGYYDVYANALNELGEVDKALSIALKGVDHARQLRNGPNEGVLNITLLHIYEKLGRFEDGIAAGERAYRIFSEMKNLERQEGSAFHLSRMYSKAGRFKEAYNFLQISRDLNDSTLKAKFDKESANLLTTFQVEEKNKEILLLNKDKELKEQELNKRNILIAGSVLLLLLSLGGIVLIINRNRLRHRIKEMQLRNEIAADLHDEVGSSLSSIRMLSEMAVGRQEGAQKEILTRVSSYTRETMEKMGDIVWMIKPSEEDGVSLKERMHGFLNELCEGKKIECAFDYDELDTVKLNMAQRKALYLVFKESVNNALKYADATKIQVRIHREGNDLHMEVKDNGKGFDISRSRTGNGLGNMQKRALEQKGQLGVQSAPGAGTTIKFMMPL